MPALLASPLKEKQRQSMIENALKEKAPRTYRALKKSGQLTNFIQDTDRNLLMTFEDSEIKAHQALPQPKTYLENLQNRNEATRQAWEGALETWLDFRDHDDPALTSE
jgi:DNA recombination-dependent growth factor C